MNNTDPRHSIKRHADGTVDFKITRQAQARTCWEGTLFGEEE